MKNLRKELLKEFKDKFSYLRADVYGDGHEQDITHTVEQWLDQALERVERETSEKWEDRGILTDCHGCGAVVHIFPGDAARLMKEYYAPFEQQKEGDK